jgi:hypothetical protein
MDALRRDLEGLSVAEASWAIEKGRVVEDPPMVADGDRPPMVAGGDRPPMVADGDRPPMVAGGDRPGARVLRWRPSEMVAPMTRVLKAHMKSEEYEAAVAAARDAVHYRVIP